MPEPQKERSAHPMTAQQQCALRYHCRLGGETVNPRFAFINRREGLSVIVTVNSGYE